MTRTIAIGTYTDTDHAALTTDLGAQILPDLAALAAPVLSRIRRRR